MEEKYKCPVCRIGVFDNPSDICDVCGWQDDDLYLTDHDYKGGPNEMSLNEARKAYKSGKEVK